MSTRYSDKGINTMSHVEIFKGRVVVKDTRRQIYHIRLDENKSCSPWHTLRFFKDSVLPHIENPFILIITGEDLTIPNQKDPRWQDTWVLELVRNVYDAVIQHPKLIHCYIENRDELHEKTSSLPLGINPREMVNRDIDSLLPWMDNIPKIVERELKVICIHRIRPGDRVTINRFRDTDWKDCTIVRKNLKQGSWWKLLQTYPFIICAHGGGIDPCPKVWEALCVGCIPIIKHSTLDDVYNEFPVVYVDSWEKDTITLDKLKQWRDELSKYYDDPERRKEWIHKLYLNYWVGKINSSLSSYHVQGMTG